MGLRRPIRAQQFSVGRAERVCLLPFCFLTSPAPFSLTLPPLPTDWDECAHSSEHDCHPSARCINLEGSYTCQCLTARDASPSRAGRVCEGMYAYIYIYIHTTCTHTRAHTHKRIHISKVPQPKKVTKCPQERGWGGERGQAVVGNHFLMDSR